MSRIRVYELAKEAGMSGKAFADKLIEKGYKIKGHSSTVDDALAEEIRRNFVGVKQEEAQAEAETRRPTTVIRRKNDQAVKEQEPEEKKAPVVERKPVVKAPSLQRQEPPVIAPKKVEDVVDAHAQEGAVQQPIKEEGPVQRQEPVAQEAPTDKPAEGKETTNVESSYQVEDKPTNSSAQDVRAPKAKVAPEVSAKAADKKEKEKPAAAHRPGTARVVGRVELPSMGGDSSRDGRGDRNDRGGDRRRPPRPNDGNRGPGGQGGPAGQNRGPRPAGAGQGGPGGQNRGPRPAGGVSSRPDFSNADPMEPQMDDRSRGKKKGGRRDGGEDRGSDRGASARGGRKGGKGGDSRDSYFGGGDYQAGPRGKRGKKKQAPAPQPPSEMKASKKRIKIYDTITVGEFAARMKIKAGDVIAKLMGLGVMATINQAVDVETAMVIAEEYGYEVEQGMTEELEIQKLNEEEMLTGEEVPRSPVVTVMGHVDHGKTSILDAIRKTDVADGEAGGITQHIGAYHVKAASGDVTFVDTPGHAAFTEMRSRGAQVTDIVILVVAADDGVMDQTREAIRHAQAAGVPIIVAVNKIDKENADPDRVKRELSDLDLAPEEWGGTTMYCYTSAKQQIGIDELMEAVQLQAEILELKADPNRKAIGRVLEAQLDKGRGPVATILVQGGTLRKGEHFVVGQFSGKVRAMVDYKGRPVTEAGPSFPVEVQGLSGVPSAGDEFIVVTDEKMAKAVSQERAKKAREAELGANSKISLDKLFEQMSEGDVRELRVVLRADVQGTLEAFAKAAADLSTKEIKVRVLHEGTGTITDSDILLASASDAIIIGFNVRPTAKVKELATKEAVDVRSYDVIYHALDDIRAAMVGMLDPTFEEEVIGDAEVRDTFSVPKIGVIAGCSVQNGKIARNAGVRVIRDGVVVYTGKISSLKRFKDDAKEVLSGYECGIGVENYNDLKIGDILEAFVMNEVEATLSES